MSMKQKTRHRIAALEEENRKLREKLWSMTRPAPPPPSYAKEYEQMKVLHDKVVLQLLEAHKRIFQLERQLEERQEIGVYIA